MIRRLSRALPLAALPLAAVLLASPALADDPRLVERLYDPTQVVTVNGQVNVQATIVFGEGETIENVAIGDSNAWQVTPNKRADLLFVKPLKASAKTNMTVVTSRNTYLFDLVAGSRGTPLYVLRFTYPEPIVSPEEQAALAAAEDQPTAAELAAASDPYSVVDPAALNFAWTVKGDPAVLPEQVFDDGDAIFLTWPRDNRIPAILIENDKGLEGPVNYAVRGDTIVVDGVPAKLILRSGQEAATLTYAGPGPVATRERAAEFAVSGD